MFFACSGRSKIFFEKLCRKIFDERGGFAFYESGLCMLNELASKKIQPDFILIDNELYKNFSDLFYEVLFMKQIRIPVLPFERNEESGEKRVLSWISGNEFRLEIQTIHKFRGIFERIDRALEDSCGINEEIFAQNEFVPLALRPKSSREPEKFPDGAEIPVEKIEKIREIENFIIENEIPPSDSKLLSFFYKNRHRDVSIEEIEETLHAGGKIERARKNIAYAYISRLKKRFKNSRPDTIKIVRTRKGFYKLLLY